MNNIKIVGTSHISKQSIKEIKNSFEDFKPDIIALELDQQRAISLLQKQKNKLNIMMIRQIGVKGYLFARIGQIVQQKLGKMVGIAPGSEMKTALKLAQKNNLKIALIDQPIKITLKNFSKTLSWKERYNFVADFFSGLFFRKRQMKKLGLDQFDLTKVPAEEVIEKMIGNLKERYPNIYKALVSDRNRYMVKQLVKLLRAHPNKKILVIVGAGHKKGMQNLLLKVDIIK